MKGLLYCTSSKVIHSNINSILVFFTLFSISINGLKGIAPCTAIPLVSPGEEGCLGASYVTIMAQNLFFF